MHRRGKRSSDFDVSPRGLRDGLSRPPATRRIVRSKGEIHPLPRICMSRENVYAAARCTLCIFLAWKVSQASSGLFFGVGRRKNDWGKGYTGMILIFFDGV